MDVLNNKIILLRKSLKSIINQTKLNLVKKIKKDKERNKNVGRKESELLCFSNNKIKPSDVPLSRGLYPNELQKVVTNSLSLEIDRVYARILTNPIIQKTLTALKEKYGIERVEKFLKHNEKSVKKSSAKRILDDVKHDKPSKTEVERTENIPKSKMKKNGNSVKTKIAEEESIELKETHQKIAKSLDPFFLDMTGENYLAAVTTALSESENSEDETQQSKPQKRLKKVSNKSFNDGKRNPKVASNNSEKKTAKLSETTKKIQSNVEELHPSWKAKQQMKKVQIQEFKGTKIKFDD